MSGEQLTYQVGDFVKLTGPSWSDGQFGLPDMGGLVLSIIRTKDNGDGYVKHEGTVFWVDGEVGSSWHGEVVGHQQYAAVINTPGYMPWADEPAVFDSIREAWAYLKDEYERMCDGLEERDNPGDYDAVIAGFDSRWNYDETGHLYAHTPGYDGDHDLGLAFQVIEYEEES